MVAHTYVVNPQSRAGALKTLEKDDLHELKVKHMVGCKDFKTASVYGTQFVIACPATYE
jgi:hypothetical protein